MNEISEVKQFRFEIGYQILMMLERDGNLPLPNKYLVAEMMQEYFIKEGIVDDIKQAGYNWEPDIKYWENNINKISLYMANNYKDYFGFLRTNGLQEGIWKFMNKGEYEKHLKFHNQDISTRVDSQNDKIEAAEKRWKIDIPRIKEVPRITN